MERYIVDGDIKYKNAKCNVPLELGWYWLGFGLTWEQTAKHSSHSTDQRSTLNSNLFFQNRNSEYIVGKTYKNNKYEISLGTRLGCRCKRALALKFEN